MRPNIEQFKSQIVPKILSKIFEILKTSERLKQSLTYPQAESIKKQSKPLKSLTRQTIKSYLSLFLFRSPSLPLILKNKVEQINSATICDDDPKRSAKDEKIVF